MRCLCTRLWWGCSVRSVWLGQFLTTPIQRSDSGGPKKIAPGLGGGKRGDEGTKKVKVEVPLGVLCLHVSFPKVRLSPHRSFGS